jgi:propanol-preferring alcohol dehydrogenase
MLSWQVHHPGPIAEGPLIRASVPIPEPGPGELLLRVLACGVCRTDLHVAEGDLPVHRPSVIPGHEIVGEVVAIGDRAHGFAVNERVGVAWLRHTCGTCAYCLRGSENLCLSSRYTGWDADGGYAEYTVVPADYALRLPGNYTDVELAPLLCAGIIGYRALQRADLPAGGRLGIYGFGGSAHLAAQVALAQGATVHVMTRSQAAQQLALQLGATSAQGAADPPPEKLDSAIIFAPAGALVPPALEALDRGGVADLATYATTTRSFGIVDPGDRREGTTLERIQRGIRAERRRARAVLAGRGAGRGLGHCPRSGPRRHKPAALPLVPRCHSQHLLQRFGPARA